jgi:4-hydroxybenzoate polyprenyltransferase
MRRYPLLFVRGAWWHYKMPPPIMLLVLLMPNLGSVFDLLLALASLISVIAFVCNFGYAINEIFDVEEDAKVERDNVASAIGIPRIVLIAALSAVTSTVIAFIAIGTVGAALTACALFISVAYSAPPIRLKERTWLGVLADASAAHVYPALLCIIIASRSQPGALDGKLIAATLIWSLTLGVRGILVHQLLDEELDRASGLNTVVHVHGRDRIIWLVKFIIAPIEIGSLIAIVWLANLGSAFWSVVLAYALVETWKVLAGSRVLLFLRGGSRHVPFLNNSFYEVWGPLAALIESSAYHAAMLTLAVLYVVLFWPRVFAELRAIAQLVYRTAMTLGTWSASRWYGR